MAVNLTATGVASVHADYSAYKDKWDRSRAVASGRDAVKAGKEKYLPYLTDQPETEYRAYLQRASFYNASWRTIAGFVGMLFRKPPTIEVPKTIEKLLADVTMSGVSLDTFAQNLAYEDLIVSRAGILVDHPTAAPLEPGQARTVKQAEDEGLRPTLALYKAEAIINWKTGRVNNKTVLTQVRLLESKTVETSEFESETFDVVRVLDLDENGEYRQRVFKVEGDEPVAFDKGNTQFEVYPILANQRMRFIPFFIVGPDGIQLEVDDPVLIDLFDVNLDHYRVSADYEQACHITAIPTPYVCGYSKDPTKPAESFYMGSTTFLVFDNADTKVGMLEYTGQGIDALEKNLARKEAQMAAIGARMLAPEKSGVEAADTLALRHSGENSILGAISVSVSTGLTEALKVFVRWAGVQTNTEIKYELNRDFLPLSADPATILAWLAVLQAGRMSPQEFLDLMKRADLVDSKKTLEEQQGEIEADPIPKPILPGNEEDDDKDEPPTNEE